MYQHAPICVLFYSMQDFDKEFEFDRHLNSILSDADEVISITIRHMLMAQLQIMEPQSAMLHLASRQAGFHHAR